VQQALLQIHCARDQFRPGAAVLPWAYAIARRLVIDAALEGQAEAPACGPVARSVPAPGVASAQPIRAVQAPAAPAHPFMTPTDRELASHNPNNWCPTIGDETIADSVCDRLVHNAHKVKLSGESLRKTRADLTKGQEAGEVDLPSGVTPRVIALPGWVIGFGRNPQQ